MCEGAHVSSGDSCETTEELGVIRCVCSDCSGLSQSLGSAGKALESAENPPSGTMSRMLREGAQTAGPAA